MKAPILLGILGAISEGSLQHLNNHHGHPFRPSATYKRHEMPSPQPPFQIVENKSISKRRLDVWKPISSDPTSAPVQVESIQPKVESTTASYWSPQNSKAPNSLDEAPQRAYVQLTAGPTATANFAPKQALNVQPAPAINKPTQKVQLPSQVPELKRPRYPPTPKRPPPRPPVQPQKIFSPARVPVPKLRKPPILPGYPPRRGIFKQAQDRKDTGFLERRPVLIAPSKKVKKKFLKPLSAPFTFSKPPLPLKEVLVIRDNEKEPRRAVDRVDTAGFEDLLLHLDKFKEDDDYSPHNPTTKAPKPTKAPSPPIKKAKLIRPTPPKPPKRPKPGKINEPPKPPKPTEQSDASEEVGSSTKPPAPPSPTTAEVPSRPIFPTIQLQRQDVLKALDAVDQSVAPLVHVATVISNSLQGVGSQSVEEVLNNERQDGEEPLDGVVETLEFTVQEILAKPEPLIILSAVLLSVITGSAIGNTITTMRSNDNREGTRFGGECPVGYEVVFIDEDGVMLRTGSVVNVRMKRESSESVVDPARRGYPFRKVTKQAVLDGGEEKEERHGGYYCKKIGDSVDTTGSKGAVGIRVNSEEHPEGGQGQVSIQVGGVSVTVGEANKLAREEVHLEMNEYDEESDEERDLGKTEDVEIGGVVDVFIDSLRQIRSLLVG